MRKVFLLCAVIAIAVLASCQKGAQRAQVVGNICTEEVAADDGSISYKLIFNDGGATYPVTHDLFTKVVYNQQANLILAYNGNTFMCFIPDGSQRGSGSYTGIEMKDGYAELKSESGLSLYFKDKDQIYATFQDYSIVGDKIFAKGVKGWGLYDMDQNYLQEMIYEKLYIINQKSAKEYDVLRCHKGKWEMVGSDESVYDAASVNDAVGLMKKAKPIADIGVLDINF